MISLFIRQYEHMNIINEIYGHPNKIGVTLVRKKEWILINH